MYVVQCEIVNINIWSFSYCLHPVKMRAIFNCPSTIITFGLLICSGWILHTDAQVQCHRCTTCPTPFNSGGVGVSQQQDCRFCEKTNVYDLDKLLKTSTRRCITVAEVCSDSLESTATTIIEKSCCFEDLCNNAQRYRIGALPLLFITAVFFFAHQSL